MTTTSAQPQTSHGQSDGSDADRSTAASRMVSLDRLMLRREDAYTEMRRVVPDLSACLEERRPLTPVQRRATEAFDQLNELVRGFRTDDSAGSDSV